jgi:hypothetical protein
MAKFTDANNQDWTVFIDIPTVKFLRQHELDVLGLFDDGFAGFEQLVADPVKLVDTISLVCQKQINERDMDADAFAGALYGDALGRAVDALVEGITDFFHDPKRRETIQAAFRKAREVESVMLDYAAEEIASMDVLEKAKLLQTEFSEPSTKSQDSSESIQEPQG